MFLRTKTVGDHTYLLLVENTRVEGKVSQRIVQRFGRVDLLRDSGQLDAIIGGLGRYSERRVGRGAKHRGETLQTEACGRGRTWRLEGRWETTGVRALRTEAAEGRRRGRAIERGGVRRGWR